ncbi:Putative FMN-dependent dehydrogenase [Rhizopus microsporus]|nr:Putative FMN-dependent dehydrogenase [Rhizopus microsporus]
MSITFKRDEVKKHSTSDSCWVIVNNKVYDVTSFLQDHPGGSEYILEFAGKDITSIMKDSVYHTHSDAAYDVLTEYYIGEVVKDDYVQERNVIKQAVNANKIGSQRDQEFLDLRKPLFSQLWNATYSKEYYLEQVHRPRYTPYTVPYFDNPYLDMLSKTNWFIVPVLWLPFVVFQLWKSLNCAYGSIQVTSQGFSIGILFWTLLEYVLHRFLFHLDKLLPDHPIALLVHFTLHGIHHHMPMDRLRLVMPPILTIILSIPVFQLAHGLFHPPLAYSFVAGAFFGYVCYDMIHYYLHHANVLKVYFRELKRYHIAHHYKNFDSGFGITSKLWDYVFGTVLYLDESK